MFNTNPKCRKVGRGENVDSVKAGLEKWHNKNTEAHAYLGRPKACNMGSMPPSVLSQCPGSEGRKAARQCERTEHNRPLHTAEEVEKLLRVLSLSATVIPAPVQKVLKLQ